MMRTTKKKPFSLVRLISGFLALLLLCAALLFLFVLSPLQKAAAAYNEAAADYNASADTYNALLQTTSADNLDGFPSTADRLHLVDTDLVSVMQSFWDGNSAKKTQADLQTIQELSDYLTEDIRILEQITAPSEAWVMARLQKVPDVLEMQAVTPDHDPNGLLNRENGGYTACIYFTSTGINVDGDSPIAKGTDGGGAIEVYSTRQDAEARCEYLHGFDDTILYTGSYAVIGTMVIRISYVYTDAEQYEMTDRITKAFTQLENS